MIVRKLWNGVRAVVHVFREFWHGPGTFYEGQAVRVTETDNSRGGVGHVVCDMGDTVEVLLEGDSEAIEVDQERVHVLR